MRVRRTAVRLGTGLFVGGATLMFAPGMALAGQGTDDGVNGDKVTICHATGSTSNPFVVITPDAEGVLRGHYDHQDQRDIIPPFTVRGESYPGLNWGSGKATYDNGCEVPDSTGTPGGGGTPGSGGSTPGGDTMKVTICHATGSQTNPFVVITPAAEGVISGHYAHQDERDIIPPFTFDGTNYPGQNWDSEGKAVFEHDCKVPGGTGTPGTPGTSGGTPVVTGSTPAASPTPSSTSAGRSSAGSPTSTLTTPSGSVHAGEYDGGISTVQGVGIALAAIGSLGTGVGLARRRLGRVNA